MSIIRVNKIEPLTDHSVDVIVKNSIKILGTNMGYINI